MTQTGLHLILRGACQRIRTQFEPKPNANRRKKGYGIGVRGRAGFALVCSGLRWFAWFVLFRELARAPHYWIV
jgi:hypothetical protein